MPDPLASPFIADTERLRKQINGIDIAMTALQSRGMAMSNDREQLDALRNSGDWHEDIGVLLDTDPLKVRDLLEAALSQIDRVNRLADKWDNTTELDTGRRSIVTGAFAAALREALEGNNHE